MIFDKVLLVYAIFIIAGDNVLCRESEEENDSEQPSELYQQQEQQLHRLKRKATTFRISDPTPAPPEVLAALAARKEKNPRTYMCELPWDNGLCTGNVRRWYYNITRKACQQVYYSGCEGNENNFETKTSCEATCESELNQQQEQQLHRLKRQATTFRLPDPTPAPPHVLANLAARRQQNPRTYMCELPWDNGLCTGHVRRWAYNITRKACQEVYYSGCAGNENNFETKSSCEAMCGSSANVPSAIMVPSRLIGHCKVIQMTDEKQCQIRTQVKCDSRDMDYESIQDIYCEDCDSAWTQVKTFSGEPVRKSRFRTLDDCMEGCQKESECDGIDFNWNSNECSFNMKDQRQPAEFERYILTRCIE